MTYPPPKSKVHPHDDPVKIVHFSIDTYILSLCISADSHCFVLKKAIHILKMACILISGFQIMNNFIRAKDSLECDLFFLVKIKLVNVLESNKYIFNSPTYVFFHSYRP